MIGLATPFRVNNYGTKLQAYAMQEVIKSYGQPVEIIDYDAPYDFRFHVLFRKVFTWQKTKARLAARHTAAAYRSVPGLLEKISSRKAAINRFDKEHLQFSEKIRGYQTLTNYSRRYSAVICGSDQIWGPLSTHTDFFTLEFAAPGVRRIAYAPSFGISTIPRSLRNRYRNFLRSLDDLSVRENQGQDIIKDLTGTEAAVVLDPTLLMSRAKWDSAIESRINTINSKYIFCYFLGKNPLHRRAIQEIRRLTGLKVVSLPHFEEMVPEDETMGDIPLYDIAPFDFLNLIKNASLVCTDSFHGTAFSTIFNKQFITFERFSSADSVSTNSRIHSLLGNLGLLGRLATDNTDLQALCRTDIIYSSINEKLEFLRNSSANFLKASLDSVS